MITEQQVVVTSVLVCLVGLIAFTIGLWVGHGREREYVDQLEDELEHVLALGGIPPKVPEIAEVAHEVGPVIGQHPAWTKRPPYPWPARCGPDPCIESLEPSAGFISRNDGTQIEWSPPGRTVLVPSAVIPPDPDASVTAWTKAMAADMDRFIRERIEGTDELLREITR